MIRGKCCTVVKIAKTLKDLQTVRRIINQDHLKTNKQSLDLEKQDIYLFIFKRGATQDFNTVLKK